MGYWKRISTLPLRDIIHHPNLAKTLLSSCTAYYGFASSFFEDTSPELSICDEHIFPSFMNFTAFPIMSILSSSFS